MRISSMLICGAVAAVGVAGSASAVVMVDSNPGSWNLAGAAGASTTFTYNFSTAVNMETASNSTFLVRGSGSGTHRNLVGTMYEIDYSGDPESNPNWGNRIPGPGTPYNSWESGFKYQITLTNDAQVRRFTGPASCSFWVYLNPSSGSTSLGDLSFTLADLKTAIGLNPYGGSGNDVDLGNGVLQGYSSTWAWYDPGTGEIDPTVDFDFSHISSMSVQAFSFGAGSWDNSDDVGSITAGSLNYTATSFSFVPAPGAAALLGAGGLITGRRRKA